MGGSDNASPINSGFLIDVALDWKEKGNAQLKKGNHIEALECYAKGIAVVAEDGPLKSQLYSNSAQVDLLLGKDDHAIEESEAAIMCDKCNAKAYWRGATAAIRLQKYEKARDFCERGLEEGIRSNQLEQLLAQAVKQIEVQSSGDHHPAANCAICLRPHGDHSEKVTLSCGHAFHQECIFELRSHGASQLCPICRKVNSRAEDAASLLDEALMLYIRSTVGSDADNKVPQDCDAAAEAATILQRLLAGRPESPWLPEVEAVASRTLACLLDVGAGVPRDQDRAVELWTCAAAAGDAGAQFHLAMRCDAAATSIELLKKAVANDHIPAHVALAAKYDTGEGGLKQDRAKAAELLQHASKHGHPGAIYSLGVKFEMGNGVKVDKKKAAELFESAVRRGHPGAMFRLGAFYNRGDGGLARDVKKAAELWEKAAIQGSVHAQYNLGIKFYTGDGVEQDTSLAEKLWEMAAVNGHKDAIHNLEALRAERAT